jgi:hypothetical protein
MATGLPTLFGHICLLEIRGPSGSAVEDDFSAAEVTTYDLLFFLYYRLFR